RDDDVRLRDRVVHRTPGDPERDRAVRAEFGARHVLAILWLSARDASTTETAPIVSATAKARSSAVSSQPVMIRLRTPSIRYETGLIVAATLNQCTWIRSRGVFIEEMNRNTNRNGKVAWIDSPEPVRSARNAPSMPNAAAIVEASTRITSAPPTPAWKRTPT